MHYPNLLCSATQHAVQRSSLNTGPHLILLVLTAKAKQCSQLQHIPQPPPRSDTVASPASIAASGGCSSSSSSASVPAEQDPLQQLVLVWQGGELCWQQGDTELWQQAQGRHGVSLSNSSLQGVGAWQEGSVNV